MNFIIGSILICFAVLLLLVYGERKNVIESKEIVEQKSEPLLFGEAQVFSEAFSMKNNERIDFIQISPVILRKEVAGYMVSYQVKNQILSFPLSDKIPFAIDGSCQLANQVSNTDLIGSAYNLSFMYVSSPLEAKTVQALCRSYSKCSMQRLCEDYLNSVVPLDIEKSKLANLLSTGNFQQVEKYIRVMGFD